MATVMTQQPERRRVRPVDRTHDRIFFGGMAALMVATVLLGFGHTYYFAGRVAADPIIHIHAAVFSMWFVLYVVQTCLIPAGKLHWHRTLGYWSYGWAVLMLVMGVLAATDLMRRGLMHTAVVVGPDPKTFYIVNMIGLLTFAVLIAGSYVARRRPDMHKRLVLYATLSMLNNAIDRWPYQAMGVHATRAHWIYLGYLLIPVVYDLMSLHRIHRATLFAAPFVAVLQKLEMPLGKTQAWHAFATFMARMH